MCDSVPTLCSINTELCHNNTCPYKGTVWNRSLRPWLMFMFDDSSDEQLSSHAAGQQSLIEMGHVEICGMNFKVL